MGAGVYQRCLFDAGSRVEVSYEEGFSFRDGMYWDVRRRPAGHWKPRRHFLGVDGSPAFDGAEGGEEFQCAQAIDSVAEVECWIRNVSRHPAWFWLPTATDKFYPDILTKLKDGRLLVVEYKGAHLVDSDDTNEKRVVGRLWEERCEGVGLSLVVVMKDGELGMRERILRKIRG